MVRVNPEKCTVVLGALQVNVKYATVYKSDAQIKIKQDLNKQVINNLDSIYKT
jgi:hypothetical protein